MLAMASVMMLLASCGTSKLAQGSGKVETGKPQTASTKASNVQQSEAVKKLTFVQKVSDNQVYAKNIVGSMSFNLQAGGKDITVPGKLSMRKDEVIRIQLFIPILGTEVGRLEFTPNYVLIVDKQGISFYSLQALFWNQLLLPGVQKVSESDLKKFDANLNAAGDVVPVTIQNGNMTYTWQAAKTTGRITSADVLYKSGQYGTSNVHIDYSDFKSVGVKFFPATQRLSMMTTATQKKQEMKINLELNEVKTDSNWSTQTEISSKYKQVSPEDVLRKIMSL